MNAAIIFPSDQISCNNGQKYSMLMNTTTVHSSLQVTQYLHLVLLDVLATCKSNSMFITMIITLSEHCPNAKISGIGIQNKWSAVIQYRCCAW